MGVLRFRALPGLSEDTEIESVCGKTIFDLGWKLDVELQSACVGKGTCGLCRIIVEEGADALSPYNEVEEKHLGNLYHLTKMRLSCQCRIEDDGPDITVSVKHKKKRKEK